MQRSNRNRRGRNERRGGSGEQQPLTNDSRMGILSAKKRKRSTRSQSPSAYDPNYVPGKDPQHVEEDVEQKAKEQELEEQQPKDTESPGVYKRKPQPKPRPKNNSETNRQRRPKRGTKRDTKRDEETKRRREPENKRRRKPGNSAQPGKPAQPRSKVARRGRVKMAKKNEGADLGRSKVYTSDTFIYKENLDPNKPTERKMRSRRTKPSDESQSED